MSRRTQKKKDSGEERVTAKSKPMMNLVSRYRVRDPNVLVSTAPESPGETKSESQNVPLNSSNVQHPSTGRPVLGASSSSYSERKIDGNGLLKCGYMVKCREQLHRHRIKLFTKITITFEKKVNDIFRKMLERSPEDAMQDIDKRSMIWRMFMSSTLEASVFMGKNYSGFYIPTTIRGKSL